MYQSSGRTHTPSEGKHQRPRSLLLEHLIAKWLSGTVSLSLSCMCVKQKRRLGHFEPVLAGIVCWEMIVIMSPPTKTFYKDVSLSQ